MRKKPELSIDGILSYQYEFKEVNELYAAFAYLMKRFNNAHVEMHEIAEDEAEAMEGYLEESYYQMINLFVKDSGIDQELEDEDLAFFFQSDMAWFTRSVQEEVEEGMEDFLEAFFNAKWSRPDVQFLFLTGEGGYAVRLETMGSFMGWYEDVEFEDHLDLPFIETKKRNAVQPPEFPEEVKKPKKAHRKPVPPQQKESINNQMPTMEANVKEAGLFSFDEKAIREVVKSFVGEVVMRGKLIHPLTPAEWQEVYDVLYGAAFLCIYAKENHERDVPTIQEVAKFLYNDKQTGQLTVALYLFAQNIYNMETGRRTGKIHEVTALLRYYDWQAFESNSKKLNKVNDTLLNMIPLVLTGSI